LPGPSSDFYFGHSGFARYTELAPALGWVHGARTGIECLGVRTERSSGRMDLLQCNSPLSTGCIVTAASWVASGRMSPSYRSCTPLWCLRTCGAFS
jgi:hypothetical protein